MKNKKTITIAAFLLLGLGELYAQESPTGAGGEATGVGGTVSYSVGQVIYTTATGTNGSVAQGVQQPYEISVITGVVLTAIGDIKSSYEKTNIKLELSIYPNPTTNYITLKVEDNTDLNYKLYDLQGKVIENKIVSSNTSVINVANLSKGTYFLNITKNSQIVKTFKVIKN